MKRRATFQPPRVWRDEPPLFWMREFQRAWNKALWLAMAKTGHGYHRPKQTREARRADKSTVPADPARFEKRASRSQQPTGRI